MGIRFREPLHNRRLPCRFDHIRRRATGVEFPLLISDHLTATLTAGFLDTAGPVMVFVAISLANDSQEDADLVIDTLELIRALTPRVNRNRPSNV
jgi:hypothetical protein